MSTAEYESLKRSNGLTYMQGKELFVSPSKIYSHSYLAKPGYDVLVKFNMKPGAMGFFNEVGVFHRTPAGISGWAVHIEALQEGEEAKVHVFDMMGRQLAQSSMSSETHKVDMTGYESGSYVLWIQSGDTVVTRKILKY